MVQKEPAMGSLFQETSFGQIENLLRNLDRFGVTRDHLVSLQRGSSTDYCEIADLIRFIVAKRTDFPIWRMITLGIFKTQREYEVEIRKLHGGVGFSATDATTNKHIITFIPRQTIENISLSIVSVSQLGLLNTRNWAYEQVLDRAMNVGFDYCPNEIAGALPLSREGAAEPSFNDLVTIGIRPTQIIGTDLVLSWDGRRKNTGLWLYGKAKGRESKQIFFSGSSLFMFVKPRR